MTKWETTKCFISGFGPVIVLCGGLFGLVMAATGCGGHCGCDVKKAVEFKYGDVVQTKVFNETGIITGFCGGPDGVEVTFKDHTHPCMWRWEVVSAPVKESVTVDNSFSNIKEQ